MVARRMRLLELLERDRLLHQELLADLLVDVGDGVDQFGVGLVGDVLLLAVEVLDRRRSSRTCRRP